MKAKEFIPAPKPRNFVAKNQKTAGAGAHKDKKRAEKQGDVKHKGKQYDAGVAEGSESDAYGNTGEKHECGSCDGTGIDTHDDECPECGGKGWVRDKESLKKKGVAEGSEDIVAVIDGVRSDRTYNDKDHAHNSLGKLVAYGKAKIAELYIDGEKVEHFELGKKYIDFEPKKLDSSMAERIRDPEDQDEGNTEPPNNFAVYINGKKWKVLPGPAGTYADSPEERRELARLQAMAQRKSQQTGKKWEVYITGEKATESIEEDTNIPFNQCPHCSGPIFHESLMNEKQDACYHKVRSRYKVWPSAYASGALVQCRKKGAKNWGNKSK